MKVLPLRRTVRRRPAKQVDPHRCHCPVHHPVTAVERNVVLAGIDRATANGDPDHAGYLRLQLDSASRCPAYQTTPTCPCGCGRKWHEHSEPMGAA